VLNILVLIGQEILQELSESFKVISINYGIN